MIHLVFFCEKFTVPPFRSEKKQNPTNQFYAGDIYSNIEEKYGNATQCSP